MTSKNSFFRNMTEDLKRRIWLIVLLGVAFFFLFPIRSIFMISDALGYMDHAVNLKETIRQSAWTMFGLSDGVTTCVFLIGAVTGLQCFAYLFDRKKVDMYHSVPMSSNKRFWISYLNGILIFSVTYLVNALITFVIWASQGIFNGNGIGIAFAGIGIQFLNFLGVYNLVIIACLLAGNFMVSVAASVVFLAYEYAVRYGFLALCELFFKTYYFDGSVYDFSLWTITLGRAFRLLNCIHVTPDYQLGSMVPGIVAGNIAYMIGYFIVTLLIAYFLYRIRPTEAAGRSIAFGKTKTAIKFLLLVPFAVVFALIFYTSSYEKVYMANIGVVLGLIIGQIVVETIMEQDIKAILKRKICFVGSGVVAIGIMLTFEYDLIGYDTYVPKESKIESGVILMSNVPNYSGYRVLDDGTYMFRDEYFKKYMNLTDAALLVKAGKYMMENFTYEFDYETDPRIFVDITYRLKNGKEVSRTINFDPYENEELMEEILQTEGYKEAAYGIHYTTEELAENNITGYYVNFEGTQKIGIDFIDEYEKDIENFTAKQLLHESPVGQIVLENQAGGNLVEMPVYASFENIGDYLKEYNINVSLETILQENADAFEYLEVIQYVPSEVVEVADSKGIYHTQAEAREENIVTIDDKETMLEILSNCIDMDYATYTVYAEECARAEIVLHQKGGYAHYFRIYKDKIPSALKDIIKE